MNQPTNQPIRVRFAPSPTGHLHIGGLRTAFFNWLFARHANGSFLLRIEDTDLERSKQEYVDSQLAAFAWAGITSDEPVVIQSQRFKEHDAVIRQLVAEGKAYRCYCQIDKNTTDRSDRAYNRACRTRTAPENPENYGAPYVVRFALPDNLEHVSWEDLIHGTVTIHRDELDDFIIARSDGRPVYNFVVVLDDAFMRITHVIRADEHIANTPKQILLYQACNYPLPFFAHVSLILGPTGTPLSKRDAATNVTYYRDEGYLPEALLNYLVRLGWSHGNQEIFTVEEMVQAFTLDHVGKHGAIFDQQKLDWLNGTYMKKTDARVLHDYIMQSLPAPLTQLLTRWTLEQQINLVKLYKERTKTLAELIRECDHLGRMPHEYAAADVAQWGTQASLDALAYVCDQFIAMPTFTLESVTATLKNACATLALPFVALAQPLRLALVGKTASPGIADLLTLVGKEETIMRIRRLQEFLSEK
jgi:glutamyl-tRNA synthetase